MKLLVTPGKTATAVHCFGKTDRQLVCTKGDSIADVPWVFGGMGIVTGTAGSAFRCLVDMNIMEILVAVSELGEGCRLRVLDEGIVVAHETESEIVRIIGGIELWCKKFTQDAEVVRAVGIMAGGAVLVFNGAVVIGIFGEEGFHVGHRFSIRVPVFPVMAGEAEVHGGKIELLGKRRDMGIVAGQTALLRCQSAMLHGDTGYFLLFARMTGKTEALGAFTLQAELEVTAVWAVTFYTAFGDRTMDVFFACKLVLFVGVAGVADVVTLCHEQLWRICRMGGMADCAPLFGNRGMLEFTCTDGLVVAEKAEAGTGALELVEVG